MIEEMIKDINLFTEKNEDNKVIKIYYQTGGYINVFYKKNDKK